MKINENRSVRELRKEAILETFFKTMKRLSENNPFVTYK